MFSQDNKQRSTQTISNAAERKKRLVFPNTTLAFFTLSALAIGQPLFDLVAKNPEFLTAQNLLDGQAEALTRKAVDLALNGDITAPATHLIDGTVSRGYKLHSITRKSRCGDQTGFFGIDKAGVESTHVPRCGYPGFKHSLVRGVGPK